MLLLWIMIIIMENVLYSTNQWNFKLCTGNYYDIIQITIYKNYENKLHVKNKPHCNVFWRKFGRFRRNFEKICAFSFFRRIFNFWKFCSSVYLSSVFELTSNFGIECLDRNRSFVEFCIQERFEKIYKLDRTSLLNVEWRFYDVESRLNGL